MGERVEWTSRMATGIAPVDDQHRHLIELYNDFEVAVEQGRGHRRIQTLLRDLIDYTQQHFAFEERHLEEHGYPDLQAHRRIHEQLVEKLERLRLEYEVHGRRITADMRRFLASWLRNHILKHDMDYLPWLRGERPVGADEAQDEPVPAD